MERLHLISSILIQLTFACVSPHLGKLGPHEPNLEILIKIVGFVRKFPILALGNTRPTKFITQRS